MSEKKFEILAPAGDETMLRAAVFSGADSVYLGIDGLNARSGAANFSGQALIDAVSFCHARNCKVYAAVNTVMLPGEESTVEHAIKEVATAGCDAIIVQDLAVAEIAKQIAPALPLHASTQTSVHSLAGVLEMAELGFSRVILSRELTLQEITHIAKHSPIELEVFVHGALCVSVSGQCYMSAFFGGRSANRGSCAGPCRLPFQASTVASENAHAPANGTNHLSLKDLSILKDLPTLREIGVVSAKIEGRLRGPEYCAVVVNSAKNILEGRPYDEKLLQDVFSRSGFTNSWYKDELSKDIFGIRTAQDTAAGKAALPKARELYRREMPRVPVCITLTISETQAVLEVSDGVNVAEESLEQTFALANNNPDEALQTALNKTGGTPFYATQINLETNGYFFAGSQAGALRRDALDELLALREIPHSYKQNSLLPAEQWPVFQELEATPAIQIAEKPTFTARFEHVSQMDETVSTFADFLVLPLWEADKVPENLRSKTWLWLPRILFGETEQLAADAIEKTKNMGFKGYEVQNVAHWHLCKGLPMRGGFGLNITNSISAARAVDEGLSTVTFSPELSLQQMQGILASVPLLKEKANFSLLGYGNMPLMITRACPIQNVADCATCRRKGYLTDRKGMQMPLLCRDDVRTILNPIPLWMADRLREVPTNDITLYFTAETTEQVSSIISLFSAHEKYTSSYTRGLYYQKQIS